MLNQEDFHQLRSLLDSSQRILILTGKESNLDDLGAGLALYLACLRLGKTVSVVCPNQPTVNLSRLVGIDKVQSDLGGQNLVISFPYLEGSIEKVSYNIEGDKFNLVIQPRPGVPPFSSQAVQFLQGGADADLIFVLGVPDLKDLGPFYEKEKGLYEKAPLVVIDRHSENKHYGKVNLVSSSASSLSEIVGIVLVRLGIDLDSDTAHNLLLGIDSATQNFSSPVTTADAFEVAANCLKAGAKRQISVLATSERKTEVKPRAKIPLQFPTKDIDQEEAPSDWLTPKIFKGSTLP